MSTIPGLPLKLKKKPKRKSMKSSVCEVLDLATEYARDLERELEAATHRYLVCYSNLCEAQKQCREKDQHIEGMNKEQQGLLSELRVLKIWAMDINDSVEQQDMEMKHG